MSDNYSASVAMDCSSKDPSKYYDPSEVRTRDGRTLGEIAGGRGIIIPRAGFDGGSLGYDPNSNKTVIVDPGEKGGGFELDLNEISKADILECTGNSTHLKGIRTHENARHAAFVAVANLADKVRNKAQSNNSHSANTIQTNGHYEPNGVIEPPSPANRTSEPTPWNSAPSAFGQTTLSPREFMEQSRKSPTTVPVLPRSSTFVAEAPEQHVTFDIDGFGIIETTYHQVVRGDDDISLVLVYDKRFKGGSRYVPAATEQPMFVDVQGWSDVFQVHSVGQHFVIGHLDCTVLFIDRVAAKQRDGG